MAFNLTTGFATLGGINRDQLISIENLTVGGSASVTGSNVANVLTVNGTGDNIIDGLGGNDTINAGGGNDTVDGGTGNDTINAGAGNDTIHRHRERGRSGWSDTYARRRPSVDDARHERRNRHTRFLLVRLDHEGQPRDRCVRRAWAARTTVANVENCHRHATRRYDADRQRRQQRLHGQGGNDTINGGGGADTINGGAGDDVITDAFSGIGDSFDGGSGIDTLIADFTWVDTVQYDLASGWMRFPGAGGTTYDTILNIENLTTAGGADVIGSAADNVITILETGGTHTNTIDGGGGNDTINAGSGNDTVNGGAGDDTIIDTQTMTGADDDVYDGGSGTDTLIHDLNWVNTVTFNLTTGFVTFGGNRDQLISIENLTVGGAATVIGNGANNVLIVNGTGDNVIEGQGGLDTINAGGGNDTIRGGFSIDTIDAGAGDDLIEILNGEFIDDVDGGTGVDTIDMSAEIGTTGGIAVNVNLATGVFTGMGGTRTVVNVENFTGTQLNDTIVGDGNANVLDGQGGNDTLDGAAGDDTLLGGAGNDMLTGGLGNDSMAGGLGDDIYSVDAAGDVVTENAGEGTDRVFSAVTYTLTAEVENLTLTGAAALDGTGNALANVIIGNSGNNVLTGLGGNDALVGGGGNDTMIGGLGDDLYYVDDAGDVVTELPGEGTDRVNSSLTYTLGANVENLTLTGAAAINGTGNALNNFMVGNGANNTLIGGAGVDIMTGGLGDDIYNADASADIVSENAGGGTDRVFASATYTLLNFVENLTLTGVSAIDGTGNGIDNVISGNAANNVLSGLGGNDTLNGGAGADTMVGDTGNDLYYVDNAGDVVTEGAAAGIDKVNSTVSYVLGANLENLTLQGAAAIDATGNGLNNILVGNNANNVIDGLGGNDSMQGALGDDTYYRDSAGDTITEAVGGGTDTAYTSVSYTLNLNVDNVILTGVAAIAAYGNVLDNVMTGNGANNVLSGNAGNDTMSGGLGNDDYAVESAGDVVIEAAAAGTDRVFSTISWTLGANLENLTLQGGGAIDGTGNGENNVIYGNGANNVLSGLGGNDALIGLGGNDTMIGGLGDDLYYVGDAGDIVSEAAGEGVDRVNSSITHTLSSEVENLTLTGAVAINGTGNGLDNTLIGNAAVNVLDGLGGNDLMHGGAGNDTLVWDAADTNVQGGADTDRLRIDGAGVVLDLTLIADNVYRDLEIIDLTGTGNNNTTLALADVLAISSTTDTLRVDGNAGDTLSATDFASWATGLDQVIDGVTYHTYTQAAGTLLVDVDILSNL